MDQDKDYKFSTDQAALTRSVLEGDKLFSGSYWAELRVFLAVAKAGSFNKATGMLGVSQPTISRQVRRLQDVLGMELLFPTKVGVRLTENGVALAKQLAALDLKLAFLSDAMKADPKTVSGRVRVSASEGLAGVFIAANLGQITKQFPQIQVLIQSLNNITSLRDNLTDMLIGPSGTEQAGVTVKKLGTLHLIPVASKHYIEKNGVPNNSNIRKHHFVQMPLFNSAASPLWEQWNNLIEEGTITHYSEVSLAYAMMVKSGLGIGLLGNYSLLEPNYVPLELDVHIPIQLYGAVLTDRLENKTVRIVFDFFCKIFSPSNPWFGNELHIDTNSEATLYDAGFRELFNIS